METEVQKFYKNKNVFITGGTGFLGKVYIEKILRVTEVDRVYVLMRPKKNKSVIERIEDIFKEPLFEQLKKSKPDAMNSVTPIFGDCMLPGLGLSSDDRSKLIEDVDLVVHSAATVRFNEPLSIAVATNLRATMDMLELAKEMIKLKAFVHVSSAFANCRESHIGERYYADKIDFSAENVLKMADILGADTLNRLSDELCKGYPNTYTFTKALAEEAVLKHGGDLPICILRPCIVIPASDEPMPGWVDNLYGAGGIFYCIASGVQRVLHIRVDSIAHIVPVDYCAGAMLVSCWSTAKSVKQISSSPPPIYNLVPDERHALSWGEYLDTTVFYIRKMPLQNMMWFPFLITTSSKLFYNWLCFFYHTLPAHIFDFLRFLCGKEKRVVSANRKATKSSDAIDYFTNNNWTFTTDHTKELWQSLSPEDQRLFKFDMCIDWPTYFDKVRGSMRQFIAKEKPETLPKAEQKLQRLLILHRMVQILIYGGGAALLLRVCFGIWLR